MYWGRRGVGAVAAVFIAIGVLVLGIAALGTGDIALGPRSEKSSFGKGSSESIPGDADADGSLTTKDAIMIAQVIYNDPSGKEVIAPGNPDADRDGAITDADIEQVLILLAEDNNKVRLGPGTIGVWGDETCGDDFIRGDVNDDAMVDVFDAFHITVVLFNGQVYAYAGDCLPQADANDDDIVDLTDPVAILIAGYTAGPSLPHPYPEPGYERVRLAYQPILEQGVADSAAIISDSDDYPDFFLEEIFMDTFTYTQSITVSNSLTLTHFRDVDYDAIIGATEPTPDVGVQIGPGQNVLAYELNFVNPAASIISGNRAVDFEGQYLAILGKYYLISEAEVFPAGSPFSGQLFSLTLISRDGREIVLTESVDVVVDDETVENFEVSFGSSAFAGGALVNLNTISLVYEADDELFITDKVGTSLPVFGPAEFTMDRFATPASEEISLLPDGDTSIKLSVPVADGIANFNLLYLDPITGIIEGFGESDTELLAITSGDSLVFYERLAGQDHHKEFIASQSQGDGAESYLLSARISEESGVNYVSIISEATGDDVCADLVSGDICEVGEVSLAIGAIVSTSVEESVVLTNLAPGGSFNQLYTKEGLQMYFDITSLTGGVSSYDLLLNEEASDGRIGEGSIISVTIGSNSNNEIQVSRINGAGVGGPGAFEVGLGTDVYENYVDSALATRWLHYTAPAQDYLVMNYHGGRSYGEIYITTRENTEPQWWL